MPLFSNSGPVVRRRSVWLRNLVSLMVAAGMIFALISDAQSADSKRKRGRRKNYILSESVGKKMLSFGQLAQDANYTEALELLQSIARKRALKPHDKAVVYQNMALMYGALSKYKEAADAYEVALEQDALPDSTTDQILYNLAQLQMANQNWNRAIELLKEWFEVAENPGAEAYLMLAAAYMQKEDWVNALPQARLAVEKSKKPVERRLGALLACEFQNANFMEAMEVLKQLATLFPKKSYYQQLAYGYSNLGEEKKALAMLELMYSQGWVDTERDLVNLAQRYIYHEIPIKAAEVLEKGLADGIVKETSENFELLANAYLRAREFERSIPPLRKAAELAKDGNLYVRLAQVYLEVEDWTRARVALEAGLEKGQLRDAGNVNLMLGISNFNEKRFQSAKAAFSRAREDEGTADAAGQWLQHVERELSKVEQG